MYKCVCCVWMQAVRLLKKGGVLVYSTCTVTLAENEEQVAWALETFPCLTLQPQVGALHPERTHSQKWRMLSGRITEQHSRMSSGAAHRRRRHAGSQAVTWAAAPPPEVQPRAELGPGWNGSAPLLPSWQGHYWVFYRQVPEKLTRGHVLSLPRLTRVFTLRHSVCIDGAVLTKTLTALFTASAPEQLLSKNCGPYRDKLHKHRGERRWEEEEGEEGARGDGE